MTTAEIVIKYGAQKRTVCRAIAKVLATRGETPKRGRGWSKPADYTGEVLDEIVAELARLGYVPT